MIIPIVISLVIGIGFFAGLIWLVEHQRKIVLQWTDSLKQIEQKGVEELEKLPFDYQQDEAWGQQSREFGRKFASLLRDVLTRHSIGVVTDDVSPSVKTETKTSVNHPTNGKNHQGKGFLQPYTLITHLNERLTLLEKLVTVHYPFPASNGHYEKVELQPWSVFWWLPALVTVIASLITLWQVDNWRVLIPWLIITLISYGVLSLVLVLRRKKFHHEAAALFESVRRLEHYGAVPYQDRVQMDMSISLLEHISEHSHELKYSIAEHKKAIGTIPTSIATEVSTQVRHGLEPTQREIETLRQQLTQSYNDMSGALSETAGRFVTLIDRIGDFDEYQAWAGHLAETSMAVTSLANTLSRYQEQTEGFYQGLQSLARSLEESQGQVSQSYAAIANSVSERTAYEEIARRELRDTIQDQTQMIHSQTEQLRVSISDMAVQARDSQRLYRAMADKLPELLQELADIGRQLRQTSQTVEDIPKQYRAALTELREQSALYITSLDEEIKGYRDQHRLYLVEIEKQSQAIGETHQQMLQKLTKGMDNYFEQLKVQLGEQIKTYEGQHRAYLDQMEKQSRDMSASYRQVLQELATEANAFQKQLTSQMDKQFGAYENRSQTYLNELERQSQMSVEAHHQSLHQLTTDVDRYLKQLKGQTEGYEEIVKAIFEVAQRIQKPEHPLFKPALFSLLTLILVCLVILVGYQI